MTSGGECAGRDRIEASIPHSGAMCLLDRVVHSDDRTIECRACSHRQDDNPLRLGGRLPIEAGLEYAAQAMALHLGLRAGDEGNPRQGFVAVVNDMAWNGRWLDTLEGELYVHASLLQSGPAGSQYAFRVDGGSRESAPELSGEALVVLAERES